jgi:hypothetical protein
MILFEERKSAEKRDAMEQLELRADSEFQKTGNALIGIWSKDSANQKVCSKRRMSQPGISGTLMLVFAICVPLPLIAQAVAAKPTPPAPQNSNVQVPFVGCKSDGQVGPVSAPAGKSKTVQIAAELAEQLAFYKAKNGSGVLAPRGWYCFGQYGSNGSDLYVAPQPIDEKLVFTPNWSGFSGPAVQVINENGETSGRFEVAQIIARVFPAHVAFVSVVIKAGVGPASSFPSGPYPQDQLTYRNNEIVEYQTPANAEGLGTQSKLQKNSSPIVGVEILTGASSKLSLSSLATRLPPNLTNLTPAIVQQLESDSAKPKR